MVVLFVSATVLPLYRNYTIAQKVGLPIIIDPVNPMGVLWLLLGPYLLPLLRLLPASLSLWTDCTEYAGGFNDRGAIHKRLGPVFIHVNPARNELVIADPTTASNVLGRRKDFIKPALFYGQFSSCLRLHLLTYRRKLESVWA